MKVPSVPGDRASPCPPNVIFLFSYHGNPSLQEHRITQRSPKSHVLRAFLQLPRLEVTPLTLPSHTPNLQHHQNDTWLSTRLTEDTPFALKRSLTASHLCRAPLNHSPPCLPSPGCTCTLSTNYTVGQSSPRELSESRTQSWHPCRCCTNGGSIQA